LTNTIYPSASGIAVQCDVTSSASISTFITTAVEKYGKIDLAVNNAGILGKTVFTAEYPEEDFDKLVSVNLKGVFLSLKYELLQIQKQEKGNHYSIVNISSAGGLSGYRGIAPYCAVKHAVVGLTKSAALEYSRSGIRINAICPYVIETPMAKLLAEDLAPMKEANPMGRFGTTEEVGEAVAWLLSGASSFTTGATLTVDGGYLCI